jgi:NAD(P)H-nitrite reductase large subunit
MKRIPKKATSAVDRDICHSPHIPGGITDTATLRKICDVADKWVQAVSHLAQRIALVGSRKRSDKVWRPDQKPRQSPVRAERQDLSGTIFKRGVQD